MSDRPILFSSPMVQALLSGTKTQTRRLVKPQPPEGFDRMLGYIGVGCTKAVFADADNGRFEARIRIQKGDRLYVREHWRTTNVLNDVAPRDLRKSETETVDYTPVVFIADEMTQDFDPLVDPPFGKHRQAMHMPRWASRLTLTVTDVRVERLQDVSEVDAKAEGALVYHCSASKLDYYGPGHAMCEQSHRAGFCKIWETINGIESWDANPWVVAYTFSVHRGNIDQIGVAA